MARLGRTVNSALNPTERHVNSKRLLAGDPERKFGSLLRTITGLSRSFASESSLDPAVFPAIAEIHYQADGQRRANIRSDGPSVQRLAVYVIYSVRRALTGSMRIAR